MRRPSSNRAQGRPETDMPTPSRDQQRIKSGEALPPGRFELVLVAEQRRLCEQGRSQFRHCFIAHWSFPDIRSASHSLEGFSLGADLPGQRSKEVVMVISP